jgi:hypothetical protein
VSGFRQSVSPVTMRVDSAVPLGRSDLAVARDNPLREWHLPEWREERFE